MSDNPKVRLALFLAICVVFGGAVWLLSGGRRAEEIGSERVPLVFVISPAHAAGVPAETVRELERQLRTRTGLAVEVRAEPTAVAAITALRDHADAGLLGLFEYLLARKEYGIEAHLQVLRRERVSEYRGEIVVRAEGGPGSLKELAGKRIAYVSPFSTSGFLLPAKLLQDAGVEVVAEFTGSHAESLSRLRAGAVDAAATYAEAVAGDGTLRCLAKTETIPHEPIAFRKGLDPAARDLLLHALQELAGAPEGKRLLSPFADITGLRPIRDEEYARAEELIRAAGKTVYGLVPHGAMLDSTRRGIEEFFQ